MRKTLQKLLTAIYIVISLVSLTYKPVAVFAWGDNEGGRDNYTKTQIDEGVLGDKIIFNAISDNSALGDGKDGNEKNFVAAREANGNNGAANVWNANEITVEDGKEYLIRLYVHNDNPNGYNAVAEDVHVSFSIPDYTAKTVEVNGFINSSNATPSEYWDYVNFNSEIPFHLEYVPGSALLENHGIGKGAGLKLSDDVVMAASGGTLIGYDELDGKIPGGFQYTAVVSIKVKVVYNVGYTLESEVRMANNTDNTWRKEVEAEVGDKIEFQITYKNTSSESQENVMLRGLLPENLKYVSGSTHLADGNHPSGAVVEQDDLVTEKGINIGNFAPGANALVRFYAKVVNENLTEGSTDLYACGRATVNGRLLQDDAKVRVEYIKAVEHFKIIKNLYIIGFIICLAFILFFVFRIRHLKKKYLLKK